MNQLRKIDIGVIVTITLAIIAFAFWLGKLDARVDALSSGKVLEEQRDRIIIELNKAAQRLAPSSEDVVPIGSIVAFSGPKDKIPKNYELCDGELVVTPGSILHGQRKPKLFGTFLRGAPAGATELKGGGSESVTLTVDQLPAHSHAMALKIVRDEIERADNYPRIYVGTAGPPEGGNRVGDLATEKEGGGQPVPITPQYQEVYWLIRVL
jgi:hypothetical protein